MTMWYTYEGRRVCIMHPTHYILAVLPMGRTYSVDWEDNKCIQNSDGEAFLKVATINNVAVMEGLILKCIRKLS
jgi:hypothetical protein